jgi:hypothetical protein
MNGLVAAGLAEVALGAVLGFPYALTVKGSEQSRRLMTALEIKHPRRVRPVHLDLIIMGILLTAAGAAVPALPLTPAFAVAIGRWTNALVFVPLIFDERLQSTRLFRVITAASFTAVSTGWVWIASIALGRL